MTLPSRVPEWLATMAAALLCSTGAGATAAEKPSGPNDSAALFPGTSSKEPISIDADKLVYYDKEHKAVYSGNVVVIQGDTKMTCSAMTVFLDHGPTQGAAGDNGSYDKAEDKVRLIGHVTLSDGQNVTKGDKLTYDLKNGLATVDTSAKSGRVHGQFVPKSSADAAKPDADVTKGGAAKPK